MSPMELLANILKGDGHYECEFPDGVKRDMTWRELHGDLRAADPEAYRVVRYRWVANGAQQ